MNIAAIERRTDELHVPHSDATIIIDALAKDDDKVLTGVKAYRKATDSWPQSDRQFIHKLDRFMADLLCSSAIRAQHRMPVATVASTLGSTAGLEIAFSTLMSARDALT
jgi:hypothetical protein